MIRVLHTLPALDGGGAEKIVFDYCIRMMDDFHFDFIVHTNYQGILEEKLEHLGCKIFHVPPMHEDRKAYKSQIDSIIKMGNYDIIHVSQGYKGLYFLYSAKRNHVPVRIAHSHMAYIPETVKEKIIRKVSTFFAKYYSTALFACGKDAACWMWAHKSEQVYIMTNAIELYRFAYDDNIREKKRRELKIEDAFVIGNVARFTYQKNHTFIIDIFEKVRCKQKNAVLLLIGHGELENQIQDKAREKGLMDSIIFLGVRNDVGELLNAMDCFLLPSRFEGLPVTLIEVQANGMPAYVSDSITNEVIIHDNIEVLPLSENADVWAKHICENNNKRKSLISLQEYDINYVVDRLKQKYMEMLLKHDN